MSNLIQSYTSWQPLEEVIVGRVYTPDYFDYITDPVVRGQLSKILEESIEDLDNLQSVIEQYGAVVKRPELPNIKQWQNEQQHSNNVSIPPLTPRDWQITLGEKLLRVLNVPEMNKICQEYEAASPGSVINPHGQNYDPEIGRAHV